MIARAVLLLAGLAVAEGTVQKDRLTDAEWNLTYEAPGLKSVLAVGRAVPIFLGRAEGGVRIALTVHEAPEPLTAKAWRARRKEQWKEKKRKLADVTEGGEPQPWLLAVEKKLGVFEEHHGYAFLVRGYHCFEVHARVDERSPTSEAAIRRALAGLRLGPDPGFGLRVRRLARLEGKPGLDPGVLLAAGVDYVTGRRYGAAHPALAAPILERARRRGGKAFDEDDRFRLFRFGGEALLAARRANDAVEWFAHAEAVAADPEKKRGSAYAAARACAVAKKLDEAFRALDRAFDGGMPVSKARLSRESEFEILRRDPRWEEFWKKAFGS